MNDYFLETQGRRIGPLSEDELRAYFRSQLLRAQDRISGGDLPEPLDAPQLAQRWQLPFRTAPTVQEAPMATVRVHATPERTQSAGVLRTAVVGLVLLLAAWWWLRPEPGTVPAPPSASVAADTGAPQASADVSAAGNDEPATRGARGAGEPGPSVTPAPSLAASTPGAAAPAGALPASAAASPTVTGASPPPATPLAAAVAANTKADTWLETAEEYSGDCCWGSLLSHSLEWTRAQPQRAEAWSYLGVAQFRNWHFEEAEAAHARALQLGPGNFLVLLNAANFHFARTQFVEAAALYHRAIDVAPGDASGWTGLGNAYSQMPDHARAIEAYEHSLSLKGHDAKVLRALGDEHYHSNQFKEAIATYDQALALAPGDADIQLALARAKQR
jgi:hypothetical protein